MTHSASEANYTRCGVALGCQRRSRARPRRMSLASAASRRTAFTLKRRPWLSNPDREQKLPPARCGACELTKPASDGHGALRLLSNRSHLADASARFYGPPVPVVPCHVQRHDRDGTSAPVPSSLLDSLGEPGKNLLANPHPARSRHLRYGRGDAFPCRDGDGTPMKEHGLPVEEARWRALVSFGGVEEFKEAGHDVGEDRSDSLPALRTD